MLSETSMKQYVNRIESELLDNILPFWMNHAADKENGGYHGEISNNLVINRHANKGALLTARILWTYSAAYRRYATPAYIEMARYAYESLIKLFWDIEFGGLYWEIGVDGQPLKTRKQIYGQAFGIYALAEYYAATGDYQALDKAVSIFDTIEKYSFDPQNQGYFEALSREWQPIADLRLSNLDMNVKKSQNTHLHILEAYTNLLRCWPDERLRNQQNALIDVMLNRITDSTTYHLILFQDEDWTPRSTHISYGHDIEASWLLCEAAEVVGDHNLVQDVKLRALQMARAVYEQGLDTDGAIFYESAPDGEIDKRKSWWPQVEASVGFLNAYQISDSEYFLQAALKSWDFIENNFIDRKYGGWFRFADHQTPEYANEPKVSFWKCPYHNSRACMELISRLQGLQQA